MLAIRVDAPPVDLDERFVLPVGSYDFYGPLSDAKIFRNSEELLDWVTRMAGEEGFRFGDHRIVTVEDRRHVREVL